MKFFSLAACAILLASCALPQKDIPPRFIPVEYPSIEGWSAQHFSDLLPMVREECRRFAHLPIETRLGGSQSTLQAGNVVGDWSGACSALPSFPVAESEAQAYFERWFVPYALAEAGDLRGYFEPTVAASAKETKAFSIPLYAKPDDLVRRRGASGKWALGRWKSNKVEPYDTRREIDSGSLRGRGLELAWLRNFGDLYLLQLQGAGQLMMTDGSVLRVGYAAHNGRPYLPIGKVLLRQNAMTPSNLSLTTLHSWMVANPEKTREILEKNANYVFFKRIRSIPRDRGAPGAMGIPLHAMRSIAVDRSFIPLGAPVYIITTLPHHDGTSERWAHITFAQDVGSDLKGAAHADLFTGVGAQAEAVASGLHARSRMIVLLPRRPA